MTVLDQNTYQTPIFIRNIFRVIDTTEKEAAMKET